MNYDFLMEVLAEKDMTIHRLEKLCDLGNGTIKHWQTKSPRVDNLLKVAEELEIPIEDLIN